MKLAKALKEKKKLTSEISHLKNLIQSKNSFIKGSNTPDKFDVERLFSELQEKIQELVNLKIVINQANKEIQSLIYQLSEYKAIISFLEGLDVKEGIREDRFTNNVLEYDVQFDELKKNELIKEYQDKADSIQDQIDNYNHTVEVSWNDENEEEDLPF